MYQLTIPNFTLPKLYVVKTELEAAQCRDAGIPYLRSGMDQEKLIRVLLYPILVKKYPWVKWDKLLGIKSSYSNLIIEVPGTEPGETCLAHEADYGAESCVSDMATDYRQFEGTTPEAESSTRSIENFLGKDLASQVNIERLQELKLLPEFLDDITTNIKRNLRNVQWWSGYNKKLGVPIGNFDGVPVADNLIILDVSGSIPRGISAMMLTLIDSLRTQANADLIITSTTSKYYPIGSELPDPETLRQQFGYGNETTMFGRILKDQVNGKHYGNVISFGDYDSCEWGLEDKADKYSNPWHLVDGVSLVDKLDIKVDKVWHYHTYAKAQTGYAIWCKKLNPNVEENFCTNWCSWIKK